MPHLDISGKWSVIRDRWHEKGSGRFGEEDEYEVVITQKGLYDVRMVILYGSLYSSVIRGTLTGNVLHVLDRYSYPEQDGIYVGRTTIESMKVTFAKDGNSGQSVESWTWVNERDASDITNGEAGGKWSRLEQPQRKKTEQRDESSRTSSSVTDQMPAEKASIIMGSSKRDQPAANLDPNPLKHFCEKCGVVFADGFSFHRHMQDTHSTEV